MQDELLLQRWLGRQDGWVDALPPFPPESAANVQTYAAELSRVVGGVAWRILRQHPPRSIQAIYDGWKWQAVAEDQLVLEPACNTMPWYQPAAGLAARLLRMQQTDLDFADTVPVVRREGQP